MPHLRISSFCIAKTADEPRSGSRARRDSPICQLRLSADPAGAWGRSPHKKKHAATQPTPPVKRTSQRGQNPTSQDIQRSRPIRPTNPARHRTKPSGEHAFRRGPARKARRGESPAEIPRRTGRAARFPHLPTQTQRRSGGGVGAEPPQEKACCNPAYSSGEANFPAPPDPTSQDIQQSRPIRPTNPARHRTKPSGEHASRRDPAREPRR